MKSKGKRNKQATDIATLLAITTTKIQHRTATSEEIGLVIRKLKGRKAPGPDNLPTEILKQLDDTNIDQIQKIIKEWWIEENMPEKELKARVVSISKKGDANKFKNYRP